LHLQREEEEDLLSTIGEARPLHSSSLQPVAPTEEEERRVRGAQETLKGRWKREGRGKKVLCVSQHELLGAFCHYFDQTFIVSPRSGYSGA
jgi:hypothetical protein